MMAMTSRATRHGQRSAAQPTVIADAAGVATAITNTSNDVTTEHASKT